jgi:[ribosomal protein S5]-alanine N-acetyltransferase
MNSANWIETPRTRMRDFEEADAESCFSWFSDPDVMQFIPGGRDEIIEDTRRRIAGYRKHQERHGFSKRLILHRESGVPIGDAGLYHLPDGERIELGFRFAKPHWGQGYAVEVGRTWLQWFDANLCGTPLFADVHPAHHRSQSVLRKLGFEPSHIETLHGMTMWIYERMKNEIQSAEGGRDSMT